MRPYKLSVPTPQKGPGSSETMNIDLDHVQGIVEPTIFRDSAGIVFYQWAVKLCFDEEFFFMRTMFKLYPIDDSTSEPIWNEPEYPPRPDAGQTIMQTLIHGSDANKPKNGRLRLGERLYADPETHSEQAARLYDDQAQPWRDSFFDFYKAWMSQPRQGFPPNPGPHIPAGLNPEELVNAPQNMENDPEALGVCQCDPPRHAMGQSKCLDCGKKIPLKGDDDE